MTKKWLYQTPDPHRIPIFYTLTKIHKPTPVGRPIISGCDGPTEKLSSFVDKILQPIAQQQESYLKDMTHFINFLEKTKVPEDTILVSMDVTGLYTNIPQEEGIHIVCKACDAFYKTEPPIPTHLLQRALRLILTENSFQFNGRDYLQIHGTAMGTKMAVAFANIFMAKVETEIISPSTLKPLIWKRLIDDIFTHWGTQPERGYYSSLNKLTNTIPLSNSRLKYLIEKQTSWTPSFTKARDLKKNRCLTCAPILNLLRPFSTLTSQRGFIKGEALRLLRTNSSKTLFQENINSNHAF